MKRAVRRPTVVPVGIVPDGKDWTALYQLLRQQDGSYKINGVHMVRTAPGPAI